MPEATDSKVLLDSEDLRIILHRLCCQLLENHDDFSRAALIGLQPRGVHFARRMRDLLKGDFGIAELAYGELDTTFFRDDFRRREKPLQPNQTRIDFLVEDKSVVFLDDVLYTGRSTRAAMDAILSFGRPKELELMVLIDRRFSRHLPIQANYIGRRIDSIDSERVKVEWKGVEDEDQVVLTQQRESHA